MSSKTIFIPVAAIRKAGGIDNLVEWIAEDKEEIENVVSCYKLYNQDYDPYVMKCSGLHCDQCIIGADIDVVLDAESFLVLDENIWKPGQQDRALAAIPKRTIDEYLIYTKENV